MQLDEDVGGLVEEELSNQNNSRYRSGGYAHLSDNSCDESLESAEDFSLDDTDLKELESKQSPFESAVSFDPNMASQLGDMEMQLVKNNPTNK